MLKMVDVDDSDVEDVARQCARTGPRRVGRAEIQQRTGALLAVHDVSFDVQPADLS
jgi:hypothetical protein